MALPALHPAAVACSVLAAIPLPVLAWIEAAGAERWREAFLASGITLAAAVLGAALALRRPLAGVRLPALGVLALLAMAAAAYAAAALPLDANLRTLSRPPAFLAPLAAMFATTAFLQMLLIGRGVPPARAGLALLIPVLSLEGQVIGAPPAFGLAAGAVLLLLAVEDGSVRVPALTPVLLLLCAFGAAAWAAADPTPAADVMVRLLALGLAFILIAAGQDGAASAGFAVAVLLLTQTAAAVLGLVSAGSLVQAAAPMGVSAWGTHLSLFERHPNVIAPWFGASAALAAALLLGPRSRLRMLGWIALPCSALLLLLSASRLALAATVLVLGLLAWLRLRALRRIALALGAAGVVLVLAVLALPTLRHKAMDTTLLIDSVEHRGYRFAVAQAAFRDRPWLGQGPRCWFRQGAFTPHSRWEGITSADHPHTLPLAIAVSAGVLGLAAFLLLLAAAARVAWRGWCTAGAGLRWIVAGVAAASLTQLLTNALDLGDAVDTVLPSRLLVDLGILAAAARAGGAIRSGLPMGPAARLATGLLLAPLALVLLAGSALHACGRRAAAQQRTAEGLDQLAAAARLLPFDVPLRLQLAGLAAADPRGGAGANRWLLEAEELAPLRPEVHELRARMRYAQGQVRPALQAAETVLRLDPHGKSARDVAPIAAELRLAAGDVAGAAQAVAKLAFHDPGSIAPLVDPQRSDALRLGALHLPVADVIAALQGSLPPDATPQARSRVHLTAFEVHLRTGRPDAALQSLDALAAIEGENPLWQVQFRARGLRARGDLDAALAAVDQALAMHENPVALADRGDVLQAMGRIAEADASYRAALALSTDLHYYEAIYRDVLGRRTRMLTEHAPGADVAVLLERLAWFQVDDALRIRNLVDAARIHTDAGNNADALRLLQRALLLLLIQPAADPAHRALAGEIGAQVGAACAGTREPSRVADRWEHRAENQGGGTLVLLFRAALLDSLGLTERARLVRRWLDGTSP